MLASLRSARSARLVVRRLATPGVLGSHGRRLCHVPDRPDLPSAANRYHREWVNLLSESLRMHTGKGLVPADCGYDADGDAHFAALAQHRSLIVVSHGIESSPVLNYATRAALDLWELEWHDFVTLESKYTAEPAERGMRSELLAASAREGLVDNYRGVRISAKGRRFEIADATIWSVVDALRNRVGTAAMFTMDNVRMLQEKGG